MNTPDTTRTGGINLFMDKAAPILLEYVDPSEIFSPLLPLIATSYTFYVFWYMYNAPVAKPAAAAPIKAPFTPLDAATWKIVSIVSSEVKPMKVPIIAPPITYDSPLYLFTGVSTGHAPREVSCL